VYETESQSATQVGFVATGPAVGHGLVQPDRDGQVVAEGLADAPGLEAAAETGDLGVMHRVAVLVDDHLGVLGIINATLPEADDVVLVPRERVVGAPLVGPDVLALGVDGGELGAEAQTLQVALGGVDEVVGHDLLEAIVVASVGEAAGR